MLHASSDLETTSYSAQSPVFKVRIVYYKKVDMRQFMRH